MSVNPPIETADQYDDTPAGWQQRWSVEISAAEKEAEKKWKRNARRITKIYLDERASDDKNLFVSKLNLFSANQNTLRAMLFGNTPRVEVGRRYEDAADDAARVAAEMLERLLNSDIGKQFSWAIGEALNDRLMVGFGIGKVRYEADFETIEYPALTEIDENGEEVVLAKAYEEEEKTSEAAPVDYVNWRDVLWSPARTWDEVRWFAFRSYLTRDECVERFGEKIGKTIPLKRSKSRGSSSDGASGDPWQRAEIWEIWCKDEQKVYWYAEGMSVICDIKDDPLELDGFFPCPMPMMANVTTGSYTPRADYILAQDQYEEVNNLTTRIMLLADALRVVGVYDKSADGIQRMLTDGSQNEMIPVDNWAMFAEKGGVRGQVDWMPLEMIVNTMKVLQEYRAELINLMYQATGMSDILRGSTQQGETATAQSIKAKFASVRVQSLQDDFARFATDLQRLRAEVMINHFDDESLVAESNMQYTTDAKYIPQALQLIRDRFAAFRIAIKSETLSAQDMAALRQEKAEFIQGLAAFIQAAAPLAERSPEAVPTLLEMLKWSMTGFKGSSQIEGVLDSAIASMQQQGAGQGQQQPSPEEIKAKAQMAQTQQKTQADLAKIAAQTQADERRARVDLQADLIRQKAQTKGKIEEQVAQQAFATAGEVVPIGNKRPPE